MVFFGIVWHILVFNLPQFCPKTQMQFAPSHFGAKSMKNNLHSKSYTYISFINKSHFTTAAFFKLVVTISRFKQSVFLASALSAKPVYSYECRAFPSASDSLLLLLLISLYAEVIFLHLALCAVGVTSQTATYYVCDQ